MGLKYSVLIASFVATSFFCTMAQSVESAEAATPKKVVVVIDPAFGGKEKGVVGNYGLEEQAVVFEVADMVQNLFARDKNVEIYLTRSRDEYRSKETREKFIQASQPILVLRLRLNSSTDAEKDGFSCRYDDRNEKSKEFAEILLDRYDNKIICPNEGIKPSKIYRDSYTPAVELFLGYLSNPNIEANLRNQEVKQTVAEIIHEAILRFVQNDDPATKKMELCLMNLRQIGLALRMYSMDNEGKYPDKLIDLHFGEIAYISTPNLFMCPGCIPETTTGDAADKRISTGYMYVKGLSGKDFANIMVAFDASPNNHEDRGRNVLFIDGHAQLLTEEKFQERLEQQKNSFVLTEVKLPTSAVKTIISVENSYKLSPNEILKCINPPMRDTMQERKPHNSFYTWDEDDGLHLCATTYGKGSTKTVLSILAHIYSNEIEGDEDLLNMNIDGDFIYRKTADKEAVIEQLEKILQEECKLDIELTFRTVERDAIVADGIFSPKEKPESSIQPSIYRIELYDEKLNADPRTGGGGSGNFDELVKNIGYYLERKTVSDIKNPPQYNFSWHFNNRAKSGPKEDLVLLHLSEQTGLTFKQEKRKMRVLFIERRTK